jgi:hypothetical protein
MTKEELLATEHIVQVANGEASYVPLMGLNKFLESNVCIPKGSNPHIDADELHKWVEDPTLDMFLISPDGTTHKTCDIKAYPMQQKTYTTKTKILPTLEWKWVRIDDGIASVIDKYYSAEEFWANVPNSDFDYAYPIEDTKRIRQ